jgi:hypothetical protein
MTVLAGCASSGEGIFHADGVEVESWESLDVTEFNRRILNAVVEGKSYPSSPLLTTIELLGDDNGIRILRIDETRNRTEGADMTLVVMVRDGFLDDSVRGDWHRIEYRLQPDRSWRVYSIWRAFRCYRGHHLESYSAKWCP